MSWAIVDDGWWSHPKVLGLSLSGRGLWVSALSWSCQQRRDLVPRQFVDMLRGIDAADELVSSGLWETDEGGWRIHDWAIYQQRSLSEKRSEAGAKGGVASGQVRRDATPKAEGGVTPDGCDVTPNEATMKQTSFASEANMKQTKQTDFASVLLHEANVFASQPAAAQTEPKNESLPSPSHPNPETEVQSKSKKLSRARRADVPAEFEQFWRAFPRRVAKQDALKAWTKRIRDGADPDKLINGATIYATWAAESGSEFVKYPATWLNGGCEDDELTLPQAPKPRGFAGIEEFRRRREAHERAGSGTNHADDRGSLPAHEYLGGDSRDLQQSP